jgi:hypothetical protein
MSNLNCFESCAICLESLSDGVPTMRHCTICKINLHQTCLSEWMKVNKTCPQCRSEIIIATSPIPEDILDVTNPYELNMPSPIPEEPLFQGDIWDVTNPYELHGLVSRTEPVFWQLPGSEPNCGTLKQACEAYDNYIKAQLPVLQGELDFS